MNPPCDPHFIATHPELHHYTTFQGLKGIVETNTIWATHYCDLNDLKHPLIFSDVISIS
jgi:hypothetical protein